jgi:hypothetical protein
VMAIRFCLDPPRTQPPCFNEQVARIRARLHGGNAIDYGLLGDDLVICAFFGLLHCFWPFKCANKRAAASGVLLIECGCIDPGGHLAN